MRSQKPYCSLTYVEPANATPSAQPAAQLTTSDALVSTDTASTPATPPTPPEKPADLNLESLGKNKGGRPKGVKDDPNTPRQLASKAKSHHKKPAPKPVTTAAPPPDFTDLGEPTGIVDGGIGTETTPTDYQQLAEVSFDMGTSTLSMVLGPEWQPKSKDERASVCVALETYYRTKQVGDMPPGVMLCFVLLAYSAPRLREPSTQEKLKIGFAWLKNRFAGIFGRRKNLTLAAVQAIQPPAAVPPPTPVTNNAN